MRVSTLDILCCPACRGRLVLQAAQSTTCEDGEEDIIEGKLTCADCGTDYPIEDGIPCLFPPES
ncbi:MAG: methytransferase partner Trm112 [Methanomicrobiaceae archaeon]|nr:methytransferase partner Trm112 [Methanomicrobiaceae archaeon]